MSKNFISGLSGINELKPLSKESTDLIRHNATIIRKSLKHTEKLNGLGFLPEGKKQLYSFSEMVKEYNTGISEDEIRAWVWYRRSLGIPMFGWEKYFISAGSEHSILLVTTQETTIKDNHFRDLQTVPAGTVLGKLLSKSHQYDGITFRFFRDNIGIRMVDSRHCMESENITTDPKKLDELVMAGALFYLNGDLLPYPIYCFGNMYDRLLELEKDKADIIKKYGINIYARHEAVIKEMRPRALTVTNPDPKERPKISVLSKFACNQEEGIEVAVIELREETNIIFKRKTSLKEAYKDWLRKLDKDVFEETNAHNIIYHYLDGHNMPRDSTPDEKSELRRTTRNEGERLFDKFLNEALKFEDQQRIDIIWNRLYNGIAPVAFHKIPIGFSCSARFQGFDFELRPAQREGIAFMELTGSGIIAYDVGLGKTITAIAELANSLLSGKCKRPLVVVPNPVYGNWIKEMIGITDKSGQFVEGILTGTGITVNEWFNLGVDVLPTINLKKPVPEKSITIVTYEGLKKIGFSLDIADDLFMELCNILSQGEKETVREQEKEYLKYEEIVGIGKKDTIADIDVLRFDYFVMDEAHNSKNIFSNVKKDENGRKRYGITGAASDMGIKTFFLTNYLQRKYGRNIMLLTATPFNNSPLEIYSMLSLVGYHSLRQMNLFNITDFFETFVQETTEDVVGYNEQIQQKDVVKSFNNRLLLQRLIYNHVAYKTGEEAGIKRPKKINLPKTNEMRDGKTYRLKPSEQVLTYLQLSVRQRHNQTKIVKKMNEAAADKVAMRSGDLLVAMNESLNNALHPALFDKIAIKGYKDFVEDSPKISYTIECIRTVREYHLKRNEAVSGQVIYCNRGKEYFHYIKEYLEKEVGYKTGVKFFNQRIDEVEIIDSSVSLTRKETIKDAFLAGICKVIIGTATIREGINLQRNGTVLYNLFADWNPTAIRQIEGRIWRQKNQFAFVRIVMPLVQDSMDVFVFQKLDEKTSRINDIWFKADRGNVLDLESLDPEEIKFALLTDIEAIAASIIRKDIVVQERKANRLKSDLEILNEYSEWKSKLETFREYVFETIKRYYNRLKWEPHIRTKPTNEELERLSNQTRHKVETDIQLYDDTTLFLESVPSDRDIIRMANRFSWRYKEFDNSSFTAFVEAVSVIKKAEKTIFESKGFSASDNTKKVIEEYNKDLQEADRHLDYLKGDDYKYKVQREVKAKKNAMAIVGKSIDERVDEFAALNYLLSYKFADLPADGSIPKAEKEPEPTPDPDDEDEILLIAIAEAEMEMLNLKF